MFISYLIQCMVKIDSCRNTMGVIIAFHLEAGVRLGKLMFGGVSELYQGILGGESRKAVRV